MAILRWRAAEQADDDAIVAMCMALNAEDPCEEPVPPDHMRRTLAALRAEPTRGRSVVLDLGEGPVGYALLVAYWSNELGGEVCNLDEIYVRPEDRGQGHGAALIGQLGSPGPLWSGQPVMLQLEVSPENARARHLYERLGFTPIRNAVLRRPVG